MDLMMGSSSSDEQGEGEGKKTYHRHTSQQIHTLQAFFKECPHPDDKQRRQLSNELGLEPKQIKFWFQNKRTQKKAEHERADNSVLRAENERIQCENLAIREALKNVICPSCGGPPVGEEERQHSLQTLKLQNALLKEEASNIFNYTFYSSFYLWAKQHLHEKVSTLLAKYTGKVISESESLTPITPTRFTPVIDMERAVMFETAATAMDELIRLLRTNEALWVKSPSNGRYVIQRDSYVKTFPRATHLRSSSARIESSKDSVLVTMNATQLVDMLLDADKWVELFPTIVTKAKTIQILETGMVGNKRNGSLQLMYEEMHVLSPFVPPREFYFLRHCQQIESGLWVVADVSVKQTSHSWKLPSGCMIQEMPNGYSKITWVEHVEVDDKTHTHRLYRDLIEGGWAYCSERWVITLQMMCERLSISNGEITDFGGVITLAEGRKSIMKLSHRMVKSFCSILNMSGELDFPQVSEEHNSGVRVCVRQSIEPGQTKGMIVSAATSLWLPLPCQTVFSLLKDEKMRLQWDVLCNGNPVNEMANISTGNIPGNCISIIQPLVPCENNMMLLQECCNSECLGAMVVYAPISIPATNMTINGEDSSNIPILPSGFIVSADRGVAANSSGSHLTLAFQILVSSPLSSKELNIQSVATVNTLVTSTVQRIKDLLNCCNFD
ncbi:hypothetical protein CRYUN_Cryun14cG0069100 [Craigia yunnanensis]